MVEFIITSSTTKERHHVSLCGIISYINIHIIFLPPKSETLAPLIATIGLELAYCSKFSAFKIIN